MVILLIVIMITILIILLLGNANLSNNSRVGGGVMPPPSVTSVYISSVCYHIMYIYYLRYVVVRHTTTHDIAPYTCVYTYSTHTGTHSCSAVCDGRAFCYVGCCALVFVCDYVRIMCADYVRIMCDI